MKKIYLQSREKKYWYESWGIIAVALILAIMISPARIFASRLAVLIATPFWYTGQYIVTGTESFASGFSNKQKLLAENEALKSEIATIKERLAYLSVLKDENNNLKNLISRRSNTAFSSTTSFRLCPPTETAIGGVVILSPEKSYYNSMLIDVGRDDGISKGDRVYTFGDIVLGTVCDVFSDKSRVILYSAAKVITPVFLGKENTSISIEGDGAGTFIAKLPKSVTLSKGDRATLPSDKLSLVAMVEQVKTSEDAPFATIYLKSPANLYSLKWVYVDRKNPINDTPPCLNVTF